MTQDRTRPPGADDVLQRAAAAARAEPEPGWIEVSASIQDRLRTAVRRTRLIRGATADGGFQVADAVLIAYLRDAVGRVPGCTLLRVVLHGEGDAYTGALVEIGAAYGLELRALADRVRTTTQETLATLLGPVTDDTAVDVTVLDVTFPDVTG